jgi:hypothetical protein
MGAGAKKVGCSLSHNFDVHSVHTARLGQTAWQSHAASVKPGKEACHCHPKGSRAAEHHEPHEPQPLEPQMQRRASEHSKVHKQEGGGGKPRASPEAATGAARKTVRRPGPRTTKPVAPVTTMDSAQRRLEGVHCCSSWSSRYLRTDGGTPVASSVNASIHSEPNKGLT